MSSASDSGKITSQSHQDASRRVIKEMKMQYSVFGLTLESEIELSGLLAAAGELADVKIQIGDVPEALAEVTGEGVVYQLNARQFRMDIRNVARYFVEDGRTITIQPYNESDMASVRLFLLGSAMGALLHQRGMLPLHASSIATDKGAVIFCGHTGAGKSTTAAAFRKRGYRVVTDDVTVLTLDDEQRPVVMPGSAEQKLWADALERLEETEHQYERVRPQLEKYAVPIREAVHKEAVPINRVFILQPHNKPEIETHPVRGLEKIMRLTPHIYRWRYLQQMGHNPQHTALFAAIAKQADVFRVLRPRPEYQLAELIKEIEERLSL